MTRVLCAVVVWGFAGSLMAYDGNELPDHWPSASLSHHLQHGAGERQVSCKGSVLVKFATGWRKLVFS